MTLPEFKVKVEKKNSDAKTYKVTDSQTAYDLLMEVFDSDTFLWTEEMIMLLFNRASEVIGYYKISSGGVSGTVSDPKVIFSIALNGCASGIMLAHNHPSGQKKPSNADRELTNKVRNAAELLDIKLIDHLIVTEDVYYSFADMGLL